MKIAIVGSGISGLTVANLLKSAHDVIIFEKQSLPGGLIKCERVNDCLFHKVGGHVFNTKNLRVSNWFWSNFNRETEFVQAKRNAKVLFNNKVIGYPIENYMYSLDNQVVKKIVSELLELQKKVYIAPLDYQNFEHFLKGNFGETLYQLYFKPYNQKIWQTDLKNVPMEWLEGKLPMPNFEQIIQNNIIRADDDNMVHSSFYYPKESGSQFIIDRLKVNLNIITSHNIEDFKKANGKISIAGTEFDRVIYCGDIRAVPQCGKNILENAGADVSYLQNLKSNGTSNLFCETDETDISWMYIPEPFTKAHRIIYTGNFSNTNNRGSNRKTCVIEFSGQVDYHTMLAEIQKLPGNLSPIAFNYEPNSYVVQDQLTRKAIKEAKQILKKDNIFLLGRFAEWEYYNMDKAMEAAFNLIDNDLFAT